MADNVIDVRIKDRIDTESNWSSKNPTPLKGERCITEGTGKYKIGDGEKSWLDLPYYEAMTASDRSKLDGIASGANKTTVDSALSSTSTNPVQNKVVNSALAGKSNTNHTHDLSTMINTLSMGSSTPKDDDYYVSQYAGGGTTTTTYHRRPLKALFEYIKSKLHKVAISGSYNDLSNKPTIPSVGNGTITIKQAGAVKGSFTTNQSGATTIELTDNNTNTWRDVIDNLTSTATDKSLSAKQGKLLNDNKAEIREWSAQIKCATWSRLCYVKQKGSVIGSSFILNISGTRNAVVYNDTFVIKVHHSQKAIISKISGSTYSTGIQVRVVSDSSGNCYVEMYENVNGATNTTTQTVYCSLIDIACGEITTYTSFIDGSSIPTGFTSNATITTNSNSLQGNLTWGEITGKPAFKTVATSGSYDDLSNKPTIGNGTVTITQGGTSKGTFTLNQTGNTTIALTDNNSWRGVQNNLTSTSTTDSLSAAQGKILNERTYQMRGDVIDNTTDFNTITSVGCYKVQMAAWGAAATYHSPNSYYASLYSYGLLTVDRAFNDGENRLIQIYYPHQSGNAANGTILTRMYNGSAWNAWDSITKGALDWSRILNKPSTFTPASHIHDDRYYTETEINNKLGDLSSLSSYGSDVTSILKAIIAKLPKTYSGSYSVTPSATNQSLSTSGKVMKDNVSVSAIPYKEESNSSGTTVTIG